MVTARATRFERNYKNVDYREPGEGYTGEEPQKGLYPFTLVDVREHTSGEGNDSVKWTLEMTEDAVGKTGDSYAGWRGYMYTNEEAAAWKEQQIMVAIGAIRPNGSYKGTLEGLLKRYGNGKVVVMGRVVRERYIPEDGEPEWVAKLTAVMRKRDEGTTRAADEDVDEEGFVEEDEKPARRPAKATRSSRKAAPAPEPEPEEEDDGDEIDLDELQEELEGLSLVALKKVAKEEYGFTAADLRGLDKEDLVEKIMGEAEEGYEDEPEDAEEPEEEEPEPPAKPARGRATATKARSRRSTRKGEEEEPPF